MVKCVVSGCPNRIVSYNRGVFNRPPKRFFHFPKEPNKVKVWLAALRETDKDPSERHVICEEHFLSEDISKKGLVSDVIPITPPFFDRPLSLSSSWGPESHEEEEQWACSDDRGEDEEPDAAPPNPPQQDAVPASKSPESISDSLQQKKTLTTTSCSNPPLSLLTRRLLELLLAAPGGSVDLRRAASSLRTPAWRLQNIVDILDDMGLVQRESDSKICWVGTASICSFMWRSPLAFLTALQRLQLVETKLNRLIATCSQQLLDLTEDRDMAALAYVSCEDLARIGVQEQTLIVIKAPPRTRLNAQEPQEDGIRLHVLAEKSPITALTCEVGGVPTSGPTRRTSAAFLDLESRIRTRSAPSEPRPASASLPAIITDSCDWIEEDAGEADVTAGQTTGGQVRNTSSQPPVMGPPCRSLACLRSSKHACSSISESDRERIFRSFWEFMNWEQRKNHTCHLVDITPVQRRRGSGGPQRESSQVFHLSVDGRRRRVCRTLFLATLGLKEGLALKWIREKRRCSDDGAVQEFPAGSSGSL